MQTNHAAFAMGLACGIVLAVGLIVPSVGTAAAVCAPSTLAFFGDRFDGTVFERIAYAAYPGGGLAIWGRFGSSFPPDTVEVRLVTQNAVPIGTQLARVDWLDFSVVFASVRLHAVRGIFVAKAR